MKEETDDDHLRGAVDEALVDELYVRSRASFSGLVLVLVILRLFLDDVFARAPALPWVFYCTVALFAVRFAETWWANKRQGWFASARNRHLSFAVGSTSTALALSAINIVAYPHLDAVQFATLAVTHTGINAIALMSLGSSPTLYHLYMVPILAPMVVMSIQYGSGLRLLPVLIVLFAFVLSAMALHEYRLRRDNVLLRLRVGEMALADSLTRLRNRRYLHEFMAGEVEQVLRDWFGPREPKRRLWLMMIDLDRFKSVNDTKGHDAGDAVLVQLGEILKQTVRRQDVVARWGGEEFVVVARDALGETGSILAERIRHRVANHEFVLPSGETLRLTCSIGYSVYPFVTASPRSLGWEEVLAIADAGLYRAKEEGRNRVVGILSGETDGGRDTLDTLKQDFERARESGLVRIAG